MKLGQVRIGFISIIVSHFSSPSPPLHDVNLLRMSETSRSFFFRWVLVCVSLLGDFGALTSRRRNDSRRDSRYLVKKERVGRPPINKRCVALRWNYCMKERSCSARIERTFLYCFSFSLFPRQDDNAAWWTRIEPADAKTNLHVQKLTKTDRQTHRQTPKERCGSRVIL